ncbi:MAG: PilT/PilU family type 4a pilus ATPase [Candidatus Omnitrophica bacterium]|nr:PilT/PilU family type 4a pilus ATPase [Candidatus Omnitrophota bacterium]
MTAKELFDRVIKEQVSDLHLCVGLPPMVRRISSLEPFFEEKLTNDDIQGIIRDILPEHHKLQIDHGKEIDIGISIGESARFRANIYSDRKGTCVALRQIPQKIMGLNALGLPGAVRMLCELNRGLVLVTGPTGSGKSTTLASIIDTINTERSEHIITLEDPIEYLHPHKRSIINQREIGTESESFSQALRAGLREDPDVILVGEMRDLETISNAVTAAETGHLVFGTLHTRNAAQSVSRIIDVFPSEQQAQIRIQFAESIHTVVSQILVPSASGNEKLLATEVMVANTAIRNLIRENKTYQIKNILESGGKEGMHTMDQSLKSLLDARKISLYTARKFAEEKSYFA